MDLARIDDLDDRLVVVNRNAAQRGALSPDLYDAIREACGRAAEPRISAVLLVAEGGFFCAGGNLNAIQERRQLDEAGRRGRIEELHDVMRAVRDCPVPVIAAIEGGAAGAGLSLSLACDLIVAEEGARFVASYVKAGLVPDGGLTSALSRALPRQLATEMCLFARPVTAERLATLGVVNVLCAAGNVRAEADALADALAAGPGVAQRAIKDLLRRAPERSDAAQMDAERDAMAQAVVGDEATEGIAAFLDKRRPDFRR